MTSLPLDPGEKVDLRFAAPMLPGWAALSPGRRWALAFGLALVWAALWPEWRPAAWASGFVIALVGFGSLVNLIFAREGIVTDRRVILLTRLPKGRPFIWSAPRSDVYFRGTLQFNRLASRRNGGTLRRLSVLDPADQAALRQALPARIPQEAP